MSTSEYPFASMRARICPVSPRATPSGFTRTRVSSVAISVSVRVLGLGGQASVSPVERCPLDRRIRPHAAENQGDDRERGEEQGAQQQRDLKPPAHGDRPAVSQQTRGE